MFMMFLLLFIGQNAWCQTVVASGELDNGITWKVENNDTGGVYSLTIEGSGDMPDFNVRNPCPWDSYLSNVYSVNISSDITKIGTGAFFGSAITSIKIPENCKEIGGKAFYRSNLKAVYIPANVETIGKDAFDYCSNLRLFHYDNSVTSKTVVNLTGISYSGKLIERATGTNGSYAKYPSNWERYTHGDQCKGGAWVAECGTKLFFYAEESGAIVNLAASGRVPAAVTNSPDYHPWRVNCYKYTSLEINKNVASIAGDELVGYENSDVTKSGFTSMKTITIENGSGNNYFYLDRYDALYDKEQTKLYLYPAKNTTTEIEIPATVTTIGSGAFYGAKKLKKITFLGTVKTFGQHAFGEASSLNYMYFTTTTAPSSYNAATFSGVANEGTVVAEANTDAFRTFTSTIGSNWTFDGETYGPVTAYILNRRLIITGKGAYNTYYANASWYPDRNEITKIIVGENITDIGGNAFTECTNVKEITLNNSGTIENGAFKNLKNLTRVNIGTGALVLDAWFDLYPSTKKSLPFEGCSKLEYINIEDFASFNNIKGLKYLMDSQYGTKAAKTLLVKGVEHSSTSTLVIPEGITKINVDFKYFKNVTRVNIPSTVEKIEGCFSEDTYLTEITIPSTVKDISYGAFNNCTSLKTVTLNNSGTIEGFVFSGCTALTRVNIGTGALVFKGVYYNETVGFHTPFEGCSNLEYINIEDFASFNNIKGLYYLMDDSYGTKAVKSLLVKGVEHSSTSTLVIPEGITNIIVDFKYFKNVTRVKIPSTVEKIEGCFSEDTYLTEITIPSTVKDISYGAFNNCTSLKTVTLNNSGTIEGFVFSGCTALTRVNIGTGALVFKGVYYNETVGFHTPFEGCSNLEYINIEDFASFNNIKGLYYLMDDSYGTKAVKSLLVKGVEHSSTSTLVIPEGITNIIVDFKYFKNVTRVKIPSTVETLGSCFAGDKYLKEITLPSTVTSVASDAFKDCTSLETVTLNNKGSIGDSAFRNCKSLGCVNIGKGLTTIDWTAGDLTDLYGDKARFPFYGCPNLSIVNVEDVNSLFTIKDIKMLTDSKYGTNACKTLMVNDAPFDSEDILHIPENVGYFSPSALKYFQNVKKISLSPNVESVSDFKDYSYLTDIILPRSVKYLEDNAFYGCSSLKRIVCLASEAPSTTAKIASNPSKITLRVPDLCSSVYKSANYWKEFNIEEGSFTRMAGTLTLKTLAKRDLNGSVSDKIVYWSSSNTDYVTVDNGVISASDFKYDGTIAPFRGAYITALSEDADTYSFSVRVQPREVVLTDGNDYKNTVDFEAEKISYTRNYKENVVEKWQAFYVPFDIEVTDELLEDYDFAKLYMVSYYDANDNGEIEDDEPLRMTFNKFSAGRVLRANMPYFIRVKSAGTKTIEVTNTTLKAAANGSVRCSTTEHEYTLVGIYEPTYMRGKYGMAANGGFTYITSARTKLGANRWYMEVKSLTEDGAEFENYARPIEIFVDGEEAETTGITTVEDKAPASQNEKIFTLDGRQVTNTDNLPSGIYIINGKKVFKK